MSLTIIKTIIFGAVVSFIVLLVSQYCFEYLKPIASFLPVNDKAYHAIFLDNGQVYFGKVDQENKETLLLKDIFYVQVQSASQDGTKQSDLSLLKLGNELHGPEDWMNINKDHILFIEQLKEDSKVAKAIADYKK